MTEFLDKSISDANNIDEIHENIGMDALRTGFSVKKSALAACGVSLRYADGTQALQNLELNVNFGEIVFLTGESGSGKTSTISLALGAFRPTGGSLEVLGEDMNSISADGVRRLRQRCGVVFQNLRLIKHQTAIENVVLPLRFLNRGGVSSPDCSLGARAMYESAAEALKKVGLAGMESKKVALFSGGEQQRVAIARAIAAGARLIIADEPTGNLDAENSLAVMRVLEKLASEGAAVLVTTHALTLINQMRSWRHYKLDRGVSTEL